MKVLDGCCLWLSERGIVQQRSMVSDRRRHRKLEGKRLARKVLPGLWGRHSSHAQRSRTTHPYVALCSLISVLIPKQPWKSNTDQYLDIKIGQCERVDCK